MTQLKNQVVPPVVQATPRTLGGVLAGLETGPVLSWGAAGGGFSAPGTEC